MSESTVIKQFIKHLSSERKLFINLHLVNLGQSKRLGIEIKEDINEQHKIKVFKKNLKTLSEIVNLEAITSLYDNCTYTNIVKNDNFVYIKKELYLKAFAYTRLFSNIDKEIIIPYNINNKRQPDIMTISVKPLFEIELDEGIIFVTKLLDNVEII